MITWSTSEIYKTVSVIQYLIRCQIFLTWVFLLQMCCYIPQNIYGNFSLNLQRSCYLTELLTFTVLFNVGVVSEGVSEEFSLTAPMSISDPSNILCIMSQHVSIKRVCMKFKPPGASSALRYFDFVPFTFHRACSSFVICRVWLLNVFFGVMLSPFCLFGRYIWAFHLTEQPLFSGIVTSHERSTCTRQDKRMAS